MQQYWRKCSSPVPREPEICVCNEIYKLHLRFILLQMTPGPSLFFFWVVACSPLNFHQVYRLRKMSETMEMVRTWILRAPVVFSMQLRRTKLDLCYVRTLFPCSFCGMKQCRRFFHLSGKREWNVHDNWSLSLSLFLSFFLSLSGFILCVRKGCHKTQDTHISTSLLLFATTSGFLIEGQTWEREREERERQTDRQTDRKTNKQTEKSSQRRTLTTLTLSAEQIPTVNNISALYTSEKRSLPQYLGVPRDQLETLIFPPQNKTNTFLMFPTDTVWIIRSSWRFCAQQVRIQHGGSSNSDVMGVDTMTPLIRPRMRKSLGVKSNCQKSPNQLH